MVPRTRLLATYQLCVAAARAGPPGEERREPRVEHWARHGMACHRGQPPDAMPRPSISGSAVHYNIETLMHIERHGCTYRIAADENHMPSGEQDDGHPLPIDAPPIGHPAEQIETTILEGIDFSASDTDGYDSDDSNDPLNEIADMETMFFF